MHNYHDTNGKFPHFTQVTPNRQNWVPYVMPYLERNWLAHAGTEGR
jgi:hypothetical protein